MSSIRHGGGSPVPGGGVPFRSAGQFGRRRRELLQELVLVVGVQLDLDNPGLGAPGGFCRTAWTWLDLGTELLSDLGWRRVLESVVVVWDPLWAVGGRGRSG